MQPQPPQNPVKPQDLSLRAPRGRVAGLRRNHVRLAVAALAAAVGVALVVGLGIDLLPSTGPRERELDLPLRETRPAHLAGLPGSYAELPQPAPPPEPAPAPGAGDEIDALGALRQQNEELRRNLASMMAAIEGIDAEKNKLLEQLARLQSEAVKEQVKAWASDLFIKLDDKIEKMAAADGNAGARPERWAQFAPAQPHGPLSAAINGAQHAPTAQERKVAFLNEARAREVHLDQPYLRPHSPYEVQAGSVIPAALLTGINTDLPGDVVAVVTAPVYDSRTGQHLLIPQGARLYGAYDSEIGNGQNRALLVWHRLLMPSGRSITLDRMRGTDAAGYAGVADRVDYHAKKLAAGAVLSSVIAYAGNLARAPAPGSRSGGDSSGGDVIGDTVAQEASRIGSKIINRQLDVQPTITVRPGWPVRVLVNKDIVLAPYTD